MFNKTFVFYFNDACMHRQMLVKLVGRQQNISELNIFSFELNPEMRESCQTLAKYLENSTEVTTKQLVKHSLCMTIADRYHLSFNELIRKKICGNLHKFALNNFGKNEDSFQCVRFLSIYSFYWVVRL